MPANTGRSGVTELNLKQIPNSEWVEPMMREIPEDAVTADPEMVHEILEAPVRVRRPTDEAHESVVADMKTRADGNEPKVEMPIEHPAAPLTQTAGNVVSWIPTRLIDPALRTVMADPRRE